MKVGISQPFKAMDRLMPRISVMDRYIVSELVGPFLFGMGAFSAIGVAIGTVFELVRELADADISLAIALQVFFLQLPYYMALSLPMAMLLATLLGYSRLSGDNEITALRSCGISLYRLMVPAVLMGFIVAGITFTVDQLVVPAAHYEATLILDRAIKGKERVFSERNIVYPEFEKVKQVNGDRVNTLVRLFYAEEFDGETMRGLTILDRSRPGFNQLVLAESATWNIRDNIWDFSNGVIYVIAPDGSYRNIVQFDRHQLPLPRTPLDFAKSDRDYVEMNLVQAFQRLEVLRLSGREKKIRKLEIRIQQKLALPFAAVAFGLIGAALGTKPQRTNKATGFGICVLMIFGYYLLMSVGDALGLSGVLPPWMAAWLPTLCGMGAGVFLLLRASRS